jgi:hypothetical protein
MPCLYVLTTKCFTCDLEEICVAYMHYDATVREEPVPLCFVHRILKDFARKLAPPALLNMLQHFLSTKASLTAPIHSRITITQPDDCGEPALPVCKVRGIQNWQCIKNITHNTPGAQTPNKHSINNSTVTENTGNEFSSRYALIEEYSSA